MGYADEAEESLRGWDAIHDAPQELTIYGTSTAVPLAPVAAELDARPLHPEFGTEPVVLYAGPSVEEA